MDKTEERARKREEIFDEIEGLLNELFFNKEYQVGRLVELMKHLVAK